jgi:hypothetical protein
MLPQANRNFALLVLLQQKQNTHFFKTSTQLLTRNLQTFWGNHHWCHNSSALFTLLHNIFRFLPIVTKTYHSSGGLIASHSGRPGSIRGRSFGISDKVALGWVPPVNSYSTNYSTVMYHHNPGLVQQAEQWPAYQVDSDPPHPGNKKMFTMWTKEIIFI